MATTELVEKRPGEVIQPERTRSGPTYRPNVDIIDQREELLLLTDVPGARAEDIDINFDRGELSIYARVDPRQPEDRAYLLREYGVGDFYRTFRIGESIDVSKIQAEVRDGVLTLHLPKSEAAKPKKIAVKSS